MRKLIFATLLPVLGACALGPDFLRPSNHAQDHQQFVNVLSSSSSSDGSFSRWWKHIDDPLLPKYIDILIRQNLELKEAGARILQARASLVSQTGDYYPSLSGNFSGNRGFSPAAQTALSTSNARQYSTAYNAELETSWEIDLFGKVRRSVEAADASFQASVYDHQALAHSLIAELLNTRIAVAVYGRLLALAESNANNRKLIYDIVKKRYDLGTQSTTLEDVLLAQENFTSVLADVNEFRRNLKNEAYAFDILLGQVPGTTNINASNFPILPAPMDIPICVPASLLDRRPDLRASELRVKAANADIGVALADLYPSLTLGANSGFGNDSINNLFTADRLAGSVLGALSARLFEGGKLRANIDLQKAEAEELSHQYAGLVLAAIGEVESSLQAQKELYQEVQALNRSVAALKKAEDISSKRYRSGLLSLREFLDTQQRRYQIEQSTILREQQSWNTRIALYLALGGDWLGAEKDNSKEKACKI